MGGCASGVDRPRGQQLKSLATIPQGTQALSQTPLPLLKFMFTLEDIRVRKCQQKEICIKFKIEDITEYTTPYKKIDQNQKANWRLSHDVQCRLTQYELRMKFLTVQAIDKQKKVLGAISINLYLIWRGPYHINLPMSLPDSVDNRVSFNFKISQGVHIQIENIQTRMLPYSKKDAGQLYTFWIEPIINQQLQPAKYSYFLKIDDGKHSITRKKSISQDALDVGQIIPELFQIGRAMTRTAKDITQVYKTSNQNIVWKKQVATQLFLPIIDKTIYTHQLRDTTLYLIFFHVVPQREYDFQIDSSCYISLSKTLNNDFKIWKNQQTKVTYQQFEIKLKQKIWLDGKEAGDAQVTLKMNVQTFEQQMMTCVRTEKGIETSSPIISSGKTKETEQIQTLKEMHNTIQKDILELQKLGHKSPQETRLLVNDIKEDLDKIIKLLSKTAKQSTMIYEYRDELQLAHGQRLLIDVGFKTIAYIRQGVHPQVQILGWEILMILLKRGELKLRSIGFTKDQRENILNDRLDQILKSKIDVGIHYLDLLNHFLELTFKYLVDQGQEAQKNFAQAFCSYAYFRIPKFRQDILGVVSKASDPQIQEWRGTTFSLLKDHHRKEREEQQFYTNLFDWEHNFYKCLSAQPQFRGNQARLQSLMKNEHGWKDRMSKRKGAFFTFVENLIKEIQYVCVVSQYIQWEYLPGYSRLLHAFLAEMKISKISQMTDRFKKCLLKMLSNQKLLDVFTVMLLKKTNIYQPQNTMTALTLIDDCFKRLKKNKRAIPTSFDYKFFLQAMKIVLNSDYELNVSKALIILYNHFNFFVPEFSLELILYLLSRYFFKFFFHWSRNLRRIFHTLIFAKVHMLRQKQEGSLVRKKKKVVDKMRTKSMEQSSTPYNSYLRIFIIQRFEYLMRVVREEVLPEVLEQEALYTDDKPYKRMKMKLSIKGTVPKSSAVNIVDKKRSLSASMAPVRFCSEGINKKMMMSKHKIYFAPQQMDVVHIQKTQKIYVKQAVEEYKQLMLELEKKYLQDPDYEPQLVAKKMKDGREKDLEQAEVDQW